MRAHGQLESLEVTDIPVRHSVLYSVASANKATLNTLVCDDSGHPPLFVGTCTLLEGVAFRQRFSLLAWPLFSPERTSHAAFLAACGGDGIDLTSFGLETRAPFGPKGPHGPLLSPQPAQLRELSASQRADRGSRAVALTQPAQSPQPRRCAPCPPRSPSAPPPKRPTCFAGRRRSRRCASPGCSSSSSAPPPPRLRRARTWHRLPRRSLSTTD